MVLQNSGRRRELLLGHQLLRHQLLCDTFERLVFGSDVHTESLLYLTLLQLTLLLLALICLTSTRPSLLTLTLTLCAPLLVHLFHRFSLCRLLHLHLHRLLRLLLLLFLVQPLPLLPRPEPRRAQPLRYLAHNELAAVRQTHQL